MVKWDTLCNVYNSLHPELEVNVTMKTTDRKSTTHHAVRLLGGFLCLLMVPCAFGGEIYRCESKGETYFSQIPCNDQAEAVVIEDHPMFSDAAATNAEGASEQATARSAPVRTPADNLREFVETLNRQRNDETAQVNQDISEVEAQLAAAEGDPADDPERVALGERLAELHASRESIAGRYDSMIAEAERRVVDMTAGSRAMAKSGEGDG